MNRITVGVVVFAILLLLVFPSARLRVWSLSLFRRVLRGAVLLGLMAAAAGHFWPRESPNPVVETVEAWLMIQAAPVDRALAESAVDLHGSVAWLLAAGLLTLAAWPVLTLLDAAHRVGQAPLGRGVQPSSSPVLKWRWTRPELAADLPDHGVSEIEKTAQLLGASGDGARAGRSEPVRLRDHLNKQASR